MKIWINDSELRERAEDASRGVYRLDNGKRTGELFSPKGEYTTSAEWVWAWAAVGDLIAPIAYHMDNERANLNRADRELAATVYAYAGSPERLGHEWLDTYVASMAPEERGRRVLESLIQIVDQAIEGCDEAFDDVARSIRMKRPLTDAERIACVRYLLDIRWRVLGNVAKLVGIYDTPPHAQSQSFNPDELKKTWLTLPRRLPVKTIPAMIYLAEFLARQLYPESPYTAVLPDEDFFSALTDLHVGIPKELAGRFSNGEMLMTHKSRVEAVGYLDSGIEPPGTTELDRAGLKYIFLSQRNTSVIVVAPTSSGKSRFGQLKICQVVHQRKRSSPRSFGGVIVVVPTKALVNQFARDLRGLLRGTEGEGWSVLEGSRDFPQNDDSIRSLQFDVAVIIPEKLSALMRNGMRVERVPLLLIDELQHIVDGSRGVRLENLLVEIFRRDPVPRIVGLSASLAKNTLTLLDDWLRTNGVVADVVELTKRPAPLTVTVLDQDRRITHKVHQPGHREETSVNLDASNKLAESVQGNRHVKNAARRGRRALALVLEILRPHVEIDHGSPRFSDTTPSIIVFVSSKSDAENLTKAMRELVASRLGVKVGRSSGRRTFAALDEKHSPIDNQVMLLPPGTMRDELRQAEATGIGYHSASLNAHAREITESGFRTGAIRVLFATDTLRLGINLPADVVVNGDLVRFAGRRIPKLLDKDYIIQRLGRAGRLGLSRGLGEGGVGQGYIVAPPGLQPGTVEIDEYDRLLFTGDRDASDATVLEQLTKVDVLAAAYVDPWSGGAHYTPPVNDRGFEEMILQYLDGLPGRRIDGEELAVVTSALFDRSLAAVHGAQQPAFVLQRLERAGAIVDVRGMTRLTDIGRSSAANAIAVDDLIAVVDLSKAARDGAGPLTLLYLACTAPFVVNSVPRIVLHDHYDRPHKEAVLEHVRNLATRTQSGQFRRLWLRHFADEVEDCIGHGDAADSLRQLLTEDPDTTGSARLTSVWRAYLIYLRWAGLPFGDIENPLDSDDQRWHIDEPALTSVAESAAYITNAASDLLGLSPETMHFRTLALFSTEIELGVPAVLAPFLFLRHRGMHRERILGMQRVLARRDISWDSLSELFSHYVEMFDAIPIAATDNEVRRTWMPLPAEMIKDITRQLNEYDQRRQHIAYSIDSRVSVRRVPRSSETFIEDDLLRVAQGHGADVIRKMIEPFQLECTLSEGEDILELALPADGTHPAHKTRLIFPDRMINTRMVDAVVADLDEGTNALIVAVKGASYGVVNRSRFLQEPCAIIDPSLLIELIARLYERHSAIDPVENSSADEWDLFLASVRGAPTQSFDTLAAQADLRRMFLNNAPVLSRADLENRMAFRDLVDTAGA